MAAHALAVGDHHRAIHMEAILPTALVAVEARRQDAQRQCGGEEQRVPFQRRQHDPAQLGLQR